MFTLDAVLGAELLVLVIVTVDGGHLCNAIQVLGRCLVLWDQAILW